MLNLFVFSNRAVTFTTQQQCVILKKKKKHAFYRDTSCQELSKTLCLIVVDQTLTIKMAVYITKVPIKSFIIDTQISISNILKSTVLCT